MNSISKPLVSWINTDHQQNHRSKSFLAKSYARSNTTSTARMMLNLGGRGGGREGHSDNNNPLHRDLNKKCMWRCSTDSPQNIVKKIGLALAPRSSFPPCLFPEARRCHPMFDTILEKNFSIKMYKTFLLTSSTMLIDQKDIQKSYRLFITHYCHINWKRWIMQKSSTIMSLFYLKRRMGEQVCASCNSPPSIPPTPNKGSFSCVVARRQWISRQSLQLQNHLRERTRNLVITRDVR